MNAEAPESGLFASLGRMSATLLALAALALSSAHAQPQLSPSPLPSAPPVRAARLAAPPARLTFTAAFGGLSEADLRVGRNADTFLTALLSATATAARLPAPGAVAISDVANVGPSGAGWGALHVRLTATFPPGTRPGARRPLRDALVHPLLCIALTPPSRSAQARSWMR